MSVSPRHTYGNPAPSDRPPDLGELVSDCEICIGRPAGCRSDGRTHWCGRVREELPGYRVVGVVGALTGHVRRPPPDPGDPAELARAAGWLARHSAAREAQADAAAVVAAGLAALPPDRLARLLDPVIEQAPAVRELRRDIDELAAAVVGGARP